MSRSRVPIRPLLCLIACAAPALAAAQTDPATTPEGPSVVVRGRVTDRTTGVPVSTAHVELRWLGGDSAGAWDGSSGITGAFATPRLRLGEYSIRVERIGFASVSQVIVFDEGGEADLRIELVPEALPLEALVVVVRRPTRLETSGFFGRRNVGIGHFFTRAEIESRAPSRVSDLFHGVPGARVVVGGGARSMSAVRLRGGCAPLIVLDGVPLVAPARLDDLLDVSHVEGIEVYHGATAPVQYSRFTNCGTIIVWTRDPRRAEDAGSGWKRLLVAGGLLGGIILLGR